MNNDDSENVFASVDYDISFNDDTSVTFNGYDENGEGAGFMQITKDEPVGTKHISIYESFTLPTKLVMTNQDNKELARADWDAETGALTNIVTSWTTAKNLRKIAKERNIKLPKNATKDTIFETIINN